MRTRLLPLVLAAALLGRPSRAYAQTGDEDTRRAIDAAVAAQVKTTLGTGPVILDPRLVRDDGWQDVRPAERTAAFAKALNATVGHHDDHYICLGLSPSSCSIRGAMTILAFSEPAVHDDSATVRMQRLDATGSPRVPVAVQDIEITLVRNADAWKVAKMVTTHRS